MALVDLLPAQVPIIGDVNASIVASSFPNGPTPAWSGTTPPFPNPGTVLELNWTNSSATLTPVVEWWVNSSPHSSEVLTAGEEAAFFDTTGLNSGDEIQGRIHYTTTGTQVVVGSSIPNTPAVSSLVTRGQIDTYIEMQTALGGTAAQWVTKQIILDNRKISGSPGSLSNTVTLT